MERTVYIPHDNTSAAPQLDWLVVAHQHDFHFDLMDAYGYVATCRSCGEVKRTPIKLGE